MNKSLPLILSSTAIIGLSFFSMNQVSHLNNKNQLLVKQDQHITELKVDKVADEDLIVDLRSENQILKEQIIILTDSIDFLNVRIGKLTQYNRRQKRAIQDVEAQLALLKSSYEQLENQINEASQYSEADRTQLAQLQRQKQDLMDQVATLETQKAEFEAARVGSEQKLMAQQLEEARYQRLSQIMNDTQVKFNKIEIQKKREGRSLKKAKKSWQYTTINFELIHEDPRLILDENFKVKIVESESQEILSYIERNPNFPDSDINKKGLDVKFEGSAVEVTYCNYQKKGGKNYEVQIFYIDGSGKEYLLRHGIRQFVKNKKVLK